MNVFFNIIRRPWKLLFPVLLWLVVFLDFLTGKNVINLDTVLSYGVAKFFVNNILNGVFPLWDPFVYLGTPFYSLVFLGLFSPLIYVMAFLVLLGVNYYESYLIYLLLNFFIGCLGYYFLAKEIIDDEDLAFFAYTALLFSGMSHIVFSQLNMLLLFVPSGWFFYFLLRFAKHFRHGDFLGLTFSVMMICNHYLPFHFITLFLVFGIVFILLYFENFLRFLNKFMLFCRDNTAFVVLCILGITVALGPAALYKLANRPDQIVTPARQCINKTPEECYASTMYNQSLLSYKETSGTGSLGERTDFGDLFFHLDKISYSNDSFFYVSVFCYLLIIIGAIARFDRKVLLLFLVGAGVFIISLGQSTPVHPFLWEHVFYFKSFRNFFFFMGFLMPLVILFSFAQFKLLMDELKTLTGPRRKVIFGGIVILHILFLAFLWSPDQKLKTTFLTVLGSLLLFIGYFYEIKILKTELNKFLLFVLIVLQPVEVFYFFNQNARQYSCELPREHVKPQFSFNRPANNVDLPCFAKLFNRFVKDFWYDMLLSDSTGAIDMPGQITRGVFHLSMYLPHPNWQEYVRYKFLAYDRVKPLDKSQKELAVLLDTLKNKENLIFIDQPDTKVLNAFSPDHSVMGAHFIAVTEPNMGFNIEHYDANSLRFKTNVTSDIMLVYTQSFHTGWKLWINGKSSRLYKIDYAFQGFWLPAGMNTVDLKYEPLGGSKVYVLITLFIQAFFLGTVIQLYREKFKLNAIET